MAYGRERDNWNNTAAIIVTLRAVLGGGKHCRLEEVHPHYAAEVKAEGRRKFKELSRAAQKAQQATKRLGGLK